MIQVPISLSDFLNGAYKLVFALKACWFEFLIDSGKKKSRW